jgi:Domain of unknown function (DUF4352)/Protein of unknown function (DUF2510)
MRPYSSIVTTRRFSLFVNATNPKPGWYPDPENPSKQRYWDGSKWSGQEIKSQSPGKPPKGSRRGVVATYRGWPMWVQIGLPILVLIIVVAAIAGGGEESSDSGESDNAGSKPEASKTTEGQGETTESTEETTTESAEDHGNPAENASDSNTPIVGPNGSVEVDTLRWRLGDSEATKTIGNQEYGLGAKANGVFIVADLSVTNNKDESVTLTSETVSLVAGDNTYDTDTNAETAFITEGGKTFFLEDLGPGVTGTGKVGFDVAPQVLNQHPQLRFNELGFGETHGYITLPHLSG